MKILAVVGDLMFRSRIEVVLQKAQFPYAWADPPTWDEVARRENPTHLVVNLAEIPADALEALDADWAVFAFGPHVERERFLAARRHGATVVANSALEPRLRQWLGVDA
jgi:hypothetical protein